MSDDASILFDYIRQTCGDCNHPHCLSIIEDAKQTLQPINLVDGELRQQIAKTIGLGDTPTVLSTNELTDLNAMLEDLASIFNAHLQAAVREAEIKGQRSVWAQIHKGEGFSHAKDGCAEVHPDFCIENIESIDQQLNQGADHAI